MSTPGAPKIHTFEFRVRATTKADAEHGAVHNNRFPGAYIKAVRAHRLPAAFSGPEMGPEPTDLPLWLVQVDITDIVPED